MWDRFCRIPGKVSHQDTLDVACDHYHRFREDIALLRSLGITQYRMSLAWPRIYPRGDGAVNPKGLDFYRGLFEALAEVPPNAPPPGRLTPRRARSLRRR